MITDLEACYHRQLANIGEILEELVGANRNAIRIITKVLPILNHFIYTGFGISSQSYGSNKDPIRGLG